MSFLVQPLISLGNDRNLQQPVMQPGNAEVFFEQLEVARGLLTGLWACLPQAVELHNQPRKALAPLGINSPYLWKSSRRLTMFLS